MDAAPSGARTSSAGAAGSDANGTPLGLLSEETRRKIRRIEIATSKLVDEMFAGKYESLFKGRGVEFAEVREYQPGDDVRTIDPNVTARTGRPFVKKHEEERELTVVLVVDASASQDFGSARLSKREVASEVAAIIAFSALRNHDKVGLLLFTDRVEKYIPPRKGRRHALRLVREILEPTVQVRHDAADAASDEPSPGTSADAAPVARSGAWWSALLRGRSPRLQPASRSSRDQASQTSVSVALDYLNRVQKRRAVVFLLSDFLGPDFERALRSTAQRHDLSGFRLFDPREEAMPSLGRLRLRDLESGRMLVVDTAASDFAPRYQAAAQQRRAQLRRNFDRCGADFAEFSTVEEIVSTLVRFFERKQARRRQMRRGRVG